MKAGGALLELVELLAWLAVSGGKNKVNINSQSNQKYYNSPRGNGLLKLSDLANVGGFLGELGGSLVPEIG